MDERNRRMVDQVEAVYQAVLAYRDCFSSAREVVSREFPSPERERILASLTAPRVDCILIFKKDEEILPETMKFVERMGLELLECSPEEKFYRAISKDVDVYKLVGTLAY